MNVSVVIATYNRGALLLDLLHDLAGQQDAGDFEVVIVDDGSKSPASEVLADAHLPFPLQLIRQENMGQARARDRGIRASSGDIVVVIDDDMSLPPRFLATHRALHEQGAEVVMGLIRGAGDLAAKPLFERFHAGQLEKFVSELRAGAPLSGSALCTGNVSFRRTRYEEVGGFDPALQRSEDRDLGIRFQKAGARLVFSEEAYTTHRSDHTSLEVWKRRAFLYGVYDHRIAQKHGEDAITHPWHYLRLVNPISRPLLVGAVCSKRLGSVFSNGAMRASEALDRLGLEGVAIKGTTLVYGLEYFMGVRSEYSSSLDAVNSLVTFLRGKRTGK